MALPEEIGDFKSTLADATSMMSPGRGLTPFTEAEARQFHEHFDGDSTEAAIRYCLWASAGYTMKLKYPPRAAIVRSILANEPGYVPISREEIPGIRHTFAV